MFNLRSVSIISAIFGFALSCNVFAATKAPAKATVTDKAVETTQPVVDKAKDVNATADKKVDEKTTDNTASK